MSYEIKVDPVKEIIWVTMKSVLQQDIRVKILLAVSNQLSASGYSRVLMDVSESTIDRDEPVARAHELVDFMKNMGFKEGLRMAFVYSDAEVHRKYFETVSNMHGLNIKYFKNHNAAVEWLEGD